MLSSSSLYSSFTAAGRLATREIGDVDPKSGVKPRSEREGEGGGVTLLCWVFL